MPTNETSSDSLTDQRLILAECHTGDPIPAPKVEMECLLLKADVPCTNPVDEGESPICNQWSCRPINVLCTQQTTWTTSVAPEYLPEPAWALVAGLVALAVVARFSRRQVSPRGEMMQLTQKEPV